MKRTFSILSLSSRGLPRTAEECLHPLVAHSLSLSLNLISSLSQREGTSTSFRTARGSSLLQNTESCRGNAFFCLCLVIRPPGALILIPSLPEGIHICVPTAIRQPPTYRLLLVRAFSSGSCATLWKGNQETLGKKEDGAQVGM